MTDLTRTYWIWQQDLRYYRRFIDYGIVFGSTFRGTCATPNNERDWNNMSIFHVGQPLTNEEAAYNRDVYNAFQCWKRINDVNNHINHNFPIPPDTLD